MKLFFASMLCAAFFAVFFSAAPVFAENVDLQTIAQSEQLSRVPYDFSDMGIAGESFPHRATAGVDGLMTLSLSGLDNAKASVTVTADDGRMMFSEAVTGNSSRDLWLAAGDYIVAVRIDEAAGEAETNLSLLMPGAPGSIAEVPTPLAGATYGGTGDLVGYMLVGSISALLALALFFVKGRLAALKKPV